MRKAIVVAAWCVLTLGIAVGVVGAEQLFWGDMQNDMTAKVRKRAGVFAAMDAGCQAVADDPKWTGTDKELKDLWRDGFAVSLGFTPPADWDANVTDKQKAAAAVRALLQSIVINDQHFTDASIANGLQAMAAELQFEPVP